MDQQFETIPSKKKRYINTIEIEHNQQKIVNIPQK